MTEKKEKEVMTEEVAIEAAEEVVEAEVVAVVTVEVIEIEETEETTEKEDLTRRRKSSRQTVMRNTNINTYQRSLLMVRETRETSVSLTPVTLPSDR